MILGQTVLKICDCLTLYEQQWQRRQRWRRPTDPMATIKENKVWISLGKETQCSSSIGNATKNTDKCNNYITNLKWCSIKFLTDTKDAERVQTSCVRVGPNDGVWAQESINNASTSWCRLDVHLVQTIWSSTRWNDANITEGFCCPLFKKKTKQLLSKLHSHHLHTHTYTRRCVCSRWYDYSRSKQIVGSSINWLF